ncbi:MAG TPA: DUF6489 family protein [Sphingomonas sp.]
MPDGPAALKGQHMKVTIDLDLTPEEARRALGLPDLTPLHDRYVARLGELVEGGIKPEMIEGMLKCWAPMGEAGLTFWRRLFEAGNKPQS